MGAADNIDQFKAGFKLSVMQRAAVIVPKISDDFVQFLVPSFQKATTLARHLSKVFLQAALTNVENIVVTRIKRLYGT